MNATSGMTGPVLVTGGAGFIGSHVCERLIAGRVRVIAVDNFDPFYDAEVKRANLAGVLADPLFRLVEGDIRDVEGLANALASEQRPPSAIIHLAARAGVRPSIEDPILYSAINVEGTVAVLELARRLGTHRFVFGSSSSVYGDSAPVPFSETEPVANPISPYAATKRSGELLCHTYHHLYGFSVVCLRFFTVYGPRQRPDLAIHKFARLMTAGSPVPMFGDGSSERDYTYIDDILDGISGALQHTSSAEPVFEIVNLGESRTTSLATLIDLIAHELGVQPKIRKLPPQPGDVLRTYADIGKAKRLFGYSPSVAVEEGIPRFVRWFLAARG